MTEDDEGDLALLPETMLPTMTAPLSSPTVGDVPSVTFKCRSWGEPTLEFVLHAFINRLYNIL